MNKIIHIEKAPTNTKDSNCPINELPNNNLKEIDLINNDVNHCFYSYFKSFKIPDLFNLPSNSSLT